MPSSDKKLSALMTAVSAIQPHVAALNSEKRARWTLFYTQCMQADYSIFSLTSKTAKLSRALSSFPQIKTDLQNTGLVSTENITRLQEELERRLDELAQPKIPVTDHVGLK